MNQIGEFYAREVYPWLSAALSWLAAPFPFSLTELLVALLAVVALLLVARLIFRRGRLKSLRRIVVLLAVTLLWFYAGWGLNYFRNDIYTRLGAFPEPYEEDLFNEFLEEFAEKLNESWCPPGERTLDMDSFETYVKQFYGDLPSEAGLCKPRPWQHPKRLTFNRLYSAVGVLGYIGPAFDEMHLNRDMTPLEQPFVFAHEYSHVLGVSLEAEANFWAFEACKASPDKAVRYSAWYSLLSFSWNNIRSLTGEEGFRQWTATLRSEIIEDMVQVHDHWYALRWSRLSELQGKFYDFFLKTNRIADGTKNYGQVLRLVMTFSDFHAHPDGEKD